MIKHVILWTLHPELKGDERTAVIDNIRQRLEGLKGQIPGLLDIRVYGGATALESSNADVMLDSTFSNIQALQDYATHPLHVHVADTFVRPFVSQRSCLDFNT